MILLPIILCVLAILPCSTTISDGRENLVDDAINALTDARADSEDRLLALSSFGPKLEKLMRAMTPIGGLVFNKTKLEPQSEEYKMLTDFESRSGKVGPTWKVNTNRHRYYGSGVEVESYVENLDDQYYENVDTNVEIMKDMTNMYIDPGYSRHSSFVEQFRAECQYRNGSPEKALEFLKLVLITYCPNSITSDQAQILADHRSYLMNVFVRLRVKSPFQIPRHEPLPDPTLYLEEYVKIYERIHREVPFEDLKMFNKTFYSYEKAVFSFFKEMWELASKNDISGYETSCLLRTEIEKSNFNHLYVKDYVNELMTRLIDLAYIAGVCANVVSDRDADNIEDYTKYIVDLTNEIASHTAKWFNESLTSAWPSAHNQILKEQIIRNKTSLESVGSATYPILQQTGQPNYAYDLMFVRSDGENYEFFFKGEVNNCYFKKDRSGFDTVIRRTPLNITDKREKFAFEKRISQIGPYNDNLMNTVRSEIVDIHGSRMEMIGSTLELMGKHIRDDLANKTNKIINRKDFPCGAVVYKQSPKFWSSCPAIDDWTSPYKSGNSSRLGILDHESKGWPFQKCEMFRFYMFI